jgi:excisionase family DNA binding protein
MPKKPAKSEVARTSPEPRYLTIKAAAAYASLTVWFVRELIWGRKVAFARLGNRYVIDRLDLEQFIEAQKVGAR